MVDTTKPRARQVFNHSIHLGHRHLCHSRVNVFAAASRVSIILVLVEMLLSSCLDQPTDRPLAPPGAFHLPPQGVYESCAPAKESFCLARLDPIASAGFQLVLNYDQLYGSASQQLAYAAKAQSLGLKIIWGLSDPAFWNGTDLLHHFKDLATTCQCSDNASFTSYVVHLVEGLSATWGYYVGDEVQPRDHQKVNVFAELVRALDPSHPRLYVSGEDPSTNGANLAPFADTAEVLGSDTYPVSTSRPLSTVGLIAQGVQSIADLHRKRSAMVLQAFSWGQYPLEKWVCSPFPACARFPTQAEMHEMRNHVLGNARPQMLLWYSYFDILRSDNPPRHWADLIQAAMAAS